MTGHPIRVAIAILHQQNRFLSQLRDDIPGILYPGHWGLFGGHLEPGETPDLAMRRELLEEIGYAPPVLFEVGCYVEPVDTPGVAIRWKLLAEHVSTAQAHDSPFYGNARVVRYVYQAPLTVGMSELTLMEGWDIDFLTHEDLQRGNRFSTRAERVCPIAQPTQQILLDFIRNH